MSKKIELLNSEGPILTAVKDVISNISIYDRHKKLVEVFNISRFNMFINGGSSITDSDGKEWIYTEQSEGMKPSINEIQEFLNG